MHSIIPIHGNIYIFCLLGGDRPRAGQLIGVKSGGEADHVDGMLKGWGKAGQGPGRDEGSGRECFRAEKGLAKLRGCWAGVSGRAERLLRGGDGGWPS